MTKTNKKERLNACIDRFVDSADILADDISRSDITVYFRIAQEAKTRTDESIKLSVEAESLLNTDYEAYQAKKFKLVGYYYDAIVGEKVEFMFYVDPTDEQIEQILGDNE